MRALFKLGKRRSDEILDLTAPASAGDGIVERWLRESMERTASEPAYLSQVRVEDAVG
jgi:hypothetical protein